MAQERILNQVAEKGGWFSFVFYLFLMMSAMPILMLFFLSLFAKNLPGIALSLVFGGIIVRDFRSRHLFATCRDLAVLNITLWFLLGFLSFAQQFSKALPGYSTYLFLIPYAVVSGYFVSYLLIKAEDNKVRVLRGGVAVSTMIAVVSAVNGAMLGITQLAADKLRSLAAEGSLAPFIGNIDADVHNVHVAFVIVLILFNLRFVRYYLKGKRRKDLWLYLIPVLTYALLASVWVVIHAKKIF